MNPKWSTPIVDKDAGEVLRWYEGLEEQTMDFIRVVPPHDTNLQVWSSKIATILVEACCLIESIFHQFKDNAATVQPDIKKPSRKPTIEDYTGVVLQICTFTGNYAMLRPPLIRR